jgi:tRNA 2-thiouridine synthesizing protein E
MSELDASAGLDVSGEFIALDADGHLLNPDQWSRRVASALAQRDRLRLDGGHWWLIDFVRDHYERYGSPPLMRMIVKAMRAARCDPEVSSRHVYQLFSDHPVRQACRYGGLPKPDWCI